MAFQPFLRFYQGQVLFSFRRQTPVSTLLEILGRGGDAEGVQNAEVVSTLLEILAKKAAERELWWELWVSTLLEILGLVYQVLVGF